MGEQYCEHAPPEPKHTSADLNVRCQKRMVNQSKQTQKLCAITFSFSNQQNKKLVICETQSNKLIVITTIP